MQTTLREHAKSWGAVSFAVMTALLLYGYCNGVYSSRRIAKACRERVDFMSVVGLDRPEFRTISEFRKRHLNALSALFGQVLRFCERVGLVKLGHVALDGTKIKANASKHKAMSYERMGKRAEELEAEGRKKPGRPAAPPSEQPDPKAQKNFTDPESPGLHSRAMVIRGKNSLKPWSAPVPGPEPSQRCYLMATRGCGNCTARIVPNATLCRLVAYRNAL